MNAFLGLVVGLILTKALIEPLAARVGKRYIPSAVARALDLLDPFMPRLLAELSPAQLEALVRFQLEKLTGESWKVERQVTQFFEVFDARIAAAKALPEAPLPADIQAFLDASKASQEST